MSCHFHVWHFAAACFLLTPAVQAREWTDVSGRYLIEADLIGFNEENVVLKRADEELGMFKIEQLSDKDREYLSSKAAKEINQENLEVPQTWTTQAGMKLLGRLVDYTRREVTVQRRRGKMFVNDRLFDSYPELYQKLLPKLVEHFEKAKIPDEKSLQKWLLSLKGQPRTFSVEGVIMELGSGEEFAVPFFIFTAEDQKVLRLGWEDWLAAKDDYDHRDDDAFRLESMAAAHARNQKVNQQVAVMDLGLQAIQAGMTSAWEVSLYPVRGNPRPPRWVVVPGRNSSQARVNAVKQNPGYTAGATRRVSW